jgi:hypothetical protein
MYLAQFAHAQPCTVLPASFEDNRIYLNVKSGSEVLKFYTDSGGGLFPFVYRDTAAKLGMKIEKTVVEDAIEIGFSSFPESLQSQSIPLSDTWNSNVRVFDSGKNIKSEASEIRFMIGDGFFGASLFAGRIWRFNYPEQQLSYCVSQNDLSGYSAIPIFFKESEGKRTSHQPRMEIEVDGTRLQVLFDTGATSHYSSEAIIKLKTLKPFTSSSFIRKSIAEAWSKKHPAWRVIKNGERFAGGGDLIEVPQIKVAGYLVGPVWFATRKDEIYNKYSEVIMDSRIDGAVGGNLFKSFDIVADYPKATLHFKKAAR